ncbi:Dynein heavy chain 2, axonemal [Collichthys lucidus]|uniref:Dynein heavy chain 2, axonemal n=1 Tax=Collichthys lucidus TaxID=240159 RepID=A0A4U5VV70_COLLU|nr:Dynein heavy chain 2, axonemal [Collichthys lucidus]
MCILDVISAPGAFCTETIHPYVSWMPEIDKLVDLREMKKPSLLDINILLEKKTFLKLGRNIVSESLLRLYLDEYEKLPWDALKYLIAGANYGGNVTDDLTFFK